MSKIGILHPGEMGISIGAAAAHNGHQVYWLSAGRSHKTRLRAEGQKFIELPDMAEFCQVCEMIISICPPHAAEDVARQVAHAGFRGIYLDANAISPQRVTSMDRRMRTNQIDFVDGSIIGGPAWEPGETWLYLSGKSAAQIASCFMNGPLETKIIGSEAGKASALKMCYAAYSKGTTALLASILATAESLGVRENLYQQWNMDDPGFSDLVNRRIMRTTAKAWRFEGEMLEIASTFQEAGLPGGFHEAAADVFQRMVDLSPTTLDQLLLDIARNTS
jgi:3-hydroxyisobutyrate dehydrogenase-like beta-hydroxyacid dehydrogenase